LAKEKELLD